MPRDSTKHTFLVATILCLVCSLVVSGAAVGLRQKQQANKELDKKTNILSVAGLYREGDSVDEQWEKVTPRLIDLATGEPVDPQMIDPESYDQRKAASDPSMSVEIPAEHPLPGIKRRGKYAEVYEIYDGGRLDQVVLPIYGKGLWSTLWGFISLDSDFNTIRGLTFYEHGETPGLGGEVDNPDWKQQWKSKIAYDDSGDVQIEVVKGAAPQGSDSQVDGLSGATITARGVSALVQYWLGEDGFGPYLDRQRSNGGQDGQ